MRLVINATEDDDVARMLRHAMLIDADENKSLA